MGIVYKTKFLQALKQIIDEDRVKLPDNKDVKQLLNLLYHKDWIVYAKAPFGGPQAVIEYLGRYTHKVAISNHSIIQLDEATVTFHYKDYKAAGVKSQVPLSNQEFARRFAQHIL